MGVSTLLSPDELEYQLNNSGAKVLVTLDFFLGSVSKVVGNTARENRPGRFPERFSPPPGFSRDVGFILGNPRGPIYGGPSEYAR